MFYVLFNKAHLLTKLNQPAFKYYFAVFIDCKMIVHA